jgi:hypothetical protein
MVSVDRILRTTLLVVVMVCTLCVSVSAVHADCDWPTTDSEIVDGANQIFVFVGVPVESKNYARSDAQRIEVTKMYKGVAQKHQWVYYDFDEEWNKDEGPDYQYGCNFEPGELNEKQLFVVERILYHNNGSQEVVKYRVLERHDIGDTRYMHIVKNIARAVARKDLPRETKIEELSAAERQEEIQKTIEILLRELSILISEYKSLKTL